MKFLKCTCTFFQLNARGFKPKDHHETCPMYFKKKLKDEWLNPEDHKRYNIVNEKRQIGVKEARTQGRLPGPSKV